MFCHFLVCSPDSSLISINGCHSIKLPTGNPSIMLGIVLVLNKRPLYKSFMRSRSLSDFQLGFVSLRLSVLRLRPTVKFFEMSASTLAVVLGRRFTSAAAVLPSSIVPSTAVGRLAVTVTLIWSVVGSV